MIQSLLPRKLIRKTIMPNYDDPEPQGKEDLLSSLVFFEWKQIYRNKEAASKDLSGFTYRGDGWYPSTTTTEVLLVMEGIPSHKYPRCPDTLVIYKFYEDPRKLMNEIMGKLLMLPVL
jgi:hypothetical protein